MSRKFNFIYSHLVQSEDDLVGVIAYSLYKKEKINFIEHFKEDNDEEDPDESDLHHFHEISQLHANNYRVLAQEILISYLDETLDGEIERIEQEATKKINYRLKELKTPFWFGSVQSLVGSICFAILLAAILMVLVGARVGYGQIAMEMLRIFNGVNMEQISTPVTPAISQPTK